MISSLQSENRSTNRIKMMRKSKSYNDIYSEERLMQQVKRTLNRSKSWYGSEKKSIFPIIDTGNITKPTIDDKVIQKESVENAEQEIILRDDVIDDVSKMSMKESCIQKEKLRITNVQEQTIKVVILETTLISGELQVRNKPKQTTKKIRKMDLESEAESTNVENDFVVLNQDQEDWSDEDTEENKEIGETTEISLIPQESKETEVQMESEIQEGNEQSFMDMQESLDNAIKITKKMNKPIRISSSNDSILEVINAITEIVDFTYRQQHGIRFEDVTDMNNYIRQQFAINHYFRLVNAFDIISDDDNMMEAAIAFVKVLYENIVRTVFLYSRMNGFLLLRCIIDNPTFDTTIYKVDDIIRELKFLKSVCNDAEMCLCLKKQEYRKEFISCIFLFEIVEFIKKNEIENLIARGVVQTMELHNFFVPNLFLIARNDVTKLYQTDAAIVAHFDLLIDNRFFVSNLYTAKRTMESKSLVVKYVNIHFQLAFLKLLMRHIATLSIGDLDKLTDLKLCFEENQRDDCRYNVLQVQEAIRNEYDLAKGIDKLARNLCCHLIFYCETDWFWSEIIRLLNKHVSMSSLIVKAFQLLPTVTEYLQGRKEPKNKTSLNLLYFIKEFLIVSSYKEFKNHRYAYFISNLCGSILNPTTIMNKILIPNLMKPMHKICVAATIEKLLEFKDVNINWSFDYTIEDINYDDENTTTETEEKVEMIRLIGAIYSQYTFPNRHTIHGARYFYIDSILSMLEKRSTHSDVFENSFTPNALKYLDELIAKKDFSWQADYYLSKILLRKLLVAREVTVPKKPSNDADEYERIEWLNQLFPITYAGVRSKPFFALAFLVNGFLTDSDLECTFVLRFNDIPEFSFIEFLILFKILLRSKKRKRLISLCKRTPGRYGTTEDKSLQEMVKWLFHLINRVCTSKRIDDTAILHAKHRILHWAEAYVTNSEVLGTDDAKAMLLLSKWSDEPGLKNILLVTALSYFSRMDRLSFEIYQKFGVWPDSLNLKMMQTWSLYVKSTEQGKQYLKDYIPPACPSSVKVYKPTRLLINNPHSDLSEFDQTKNIPFDFQTKIGNIWQTSLSINRYLDFRQERSNFSQSMNLPISQNDQNKICQMQIPYKSRFIIPLDIFAHEINFGAGAAIRRSNSLPNNFASFSAPVKKVIPSLRDLLKQKKLKIRQESTKPAILTDQKQNSKILQQEGTDDSMKNLRPIPLKMIEKRIYPTYCSVPAIYHYFWKQRQINKERTLFHSFLEIGGSCENCGRIDHTENFCPKMPNYANLLDNLLPVTYKWTIKNEETFGNLHRQDSWESFDDEEDS
ncbi:Prepilin leader peptidase/N-methyltransferase [Dirofilaria immitis]